MTMPNCEPQVSSASSEALLSGEAFVKLHGKSSRSVVTTATVPTDVSESGDDDFDDSSIVLVVETVDDSSDDESCGRCGMEKNSVTRPAKHVPPVQTVDLLSGDPFPDSNPNSVEPDFAEDAVVRKPRSLPSLLDSNKKTNDAKKNKKDTKRSKINTTKDRPMTTVRQQRRAEIPESLQKAKRARRAAIRKWDSAPKPGPNRTVYDLYVPPPHQTAAAAKKEKRKKKKKRERKTLAGAIGGMVAGAFIGGPIGVAVGAAAGGFCTRHAAKKSEKRKQRKREQRSFRDYATAKGLQWHMNGDAAVFC